MQHMMDAGKAMRDNMKLNRFRLVVVSDNDSAAVTMQHVFDSLHDLDGKMHLHVVALEALPEELILRATLPV